MTTTHDACDTCGNHVDSVPHRDNCLGIPPTQEEWAAVETLRDPPVMDHNVIADR